MAKKTTTANEIQFFPLANFVENDDNPRDVLEDNTQMVNSLLVFPKMLTKRPLAYENRDGRFVVLGGNYRLRGLNEIAGYTMDIIKERLLGLVGFEKKSETEKEALLGFWADWLDNPEAAGICLDDFTEDEKKEFIIKDNLSYGKWDEEALMKWNKEELKEWGLDTIDFTPIEELAEDIEPPTLEKPEYIMVSLPSSYKDKREEIKKLLISALSNDFFECEVK